jgi:hypothetical protein
MSNGSIPPEWLAMSRQERDALVVLRGVEKGKYTQVEAGRLLHLGVRQVRRKLVDLRIEGDSSLVHKLRGQPSNHRSKASFKKKVLALYRKKYWDFGPTFACEKLAAEGLPVGVETLRRWLLAEGLWERQRRRDPHRSRRPRRACFGELVQMDASIHDWLEGRGDNRRCDGSSDGEVLPVGDGRSAHGFARRVVAEVRSSGFGVHGSPRHLRGSREGSAAVGSGRGDPVRQGFA